MDGATGADIIDIRTVRVDVTTIKLLFAVPHDVGYGGVDKTSVAVRLYIVGVVVVTGEGAPVERYTIYITSTLLTRKHYGVNNVIEVGDIR